MLTFANLSVDQLRHYIANFEADRHRWDRQDLDTFQDLLTALSARLLAA